ncbi:AraC-like DNA-binding protein [Raoultella planticola]|uniref:AraC family transcriptional regulator n=1 Tax=Raoultella planticola TaxID=575 RepID=UPI001062A8C0|nr:AraC family transcriptional regulator [Raoultella planticola]TDV02382.1 AraC-like DNA-binding protein [Raoultella planticola]TDX33535.1 AraC-like DNA-binding protein [Raoultella planticola]
MKLKNIHLYNYVMLFTKNCELYIQKTDEQVFIPHRTIVILEKNTFFDISLIRKGSGEAYEYFELDGDALSCLSNILETTIKVSPESYTRKRALNERIFKIKSCSITIEFFDRLKDGVIDDLSKACKLAYLISKCEELPKLAVSIYSSAAVSFSEKITQLLFTDLSKKWKLSDIADEMHISEISVRKKLEQESMNFNQLLLDVRMNRAAKYIVRSDYQIGMIASLVGYASTSYFIKTFKDYYGITPKQFHLGIKENHCWD